MAVDREGDAAKLRAQFLDAADEGAVLLGQGVADRVRQVDRGRAGPDRLAADEREELELGARRVLGRELDLVGALGRVAHRPSDAFENLAGLELELALHVHGARRDEDMDPGAASHRRAPRRTHRCRRARIARAPRRWSTVRRRRRCVRPRSLRGKKPRSPPRSRRRRAARAARRSPPSRAGASAMPGDCSPSRSVVSKIVILRVDN